MKRLLVLMCVLMVSVSVVVAESNFPGQAKAATSSALTVTVQTVTQSAPALAKEEAAGAATAEKAVAAPTQKVVVATYEVPMIQEQWFPDGTTVYLAGDIAGWPRDVDYRKMPFTVIADGKMAFRLVRANGKPYTGVLTGIAVFKVVTNPDELAELIAAKKIKASEPYLFVNVDEASPYAIKQKTEEIKYAIDCGAILKATTP